MIPYRYSEKVAVDPSPQYKAVRVLDEEMGQCGLDLPPPLELGVTVEAGLGAILVADQIAGIDLRY